MLTIHFGIGGGGGAGGGTAGAAAARAAPGTAAPADFADGGGVRSSTNCAYAQFSVSTLVAIAP
jgi:hypothetical protein